jgi:geranylgeranyl diphosphate synthase type 3
VLFYQNIKYLFLTEKAITITLGVQMMQLFSENKTDFTKMTGIFGRYFQIRDDYCILCLQEVTLTYQF